MNFFNPGSPRFRRGVMLLSVYACTFVGAHVVMGDFGKQEHVFTPVQKWILPRIDALFGITEEEIKNFVEEVPKTEQWLTLKKSDK